MPPLSKKGKSEQPRGKRKGQCAEISRIHNKRELQRRFCVGFLVTLETVTVMATVHGECGLRMEKAVTIYFCAVCSWSVVFSGCHECE